MIFHVLWEGACALFAAAVLLVAYLFLPPRWYRQMVCRWRFLCRWWAWHEWETDPARDKSEAPRESLRCSRCGVLATRRKVVQAIPP